jgi:hypothetical protein
MGFCLIALWIAVSQGNMDPGVLFGSKEFIEKRTMDTIKVRAIEAWSCIHL